MYMRAVNNLICMLVIALTDCPYEKKETRVSSLLYPLVQWLSVQLETKKSLVLALLLVCLFTYLFICLFGCFLCLSWE